MSKTAFTTFAAAAALSLGLIAPASQARAGADPFLGELMLAGFNFCPRGWAEANGALLPISSNTALFSLLGTMYGGDGRTTFALPDLRGRVAIGVGAGPGLQPITQGERLGQPTTTQTIATMAPHTHMATSNASTSIHVSSDDANIQDPGNAFLGTTSTPTYTTTQPDEVLANGSATTGVTTTILSTGQGLPQENHQPSLGLKYCIALVGLYPSRS